MAIIEKIQVGGSTYDIGVQGPHISGQIPVDTLPSIPVSKLSGTISTNNLPTIPASKLPSYVDDVIEGYYSGGKFYSDDKKTQEITGETGKIYVDKTGDSGLSYRWSGSKYIAIKSGGINDATISVAFAGSSQSFTANQASNVNISMSAYNVVASTTTASDNASAANGSVRLNAVNTLGSNKKAISSTLISGKGATTVTADASGNIIINSTDTNTKVTSADNHYGPTSDTNSTITKNASASTAAGWNDTSLVTGISVYRDSKGHVTDVTLTSVKMPANPNTDTKVDSAANHYDPTKETISTLGGAASTTTAASWGTTDFITGVTIKKDPKGHITGLTLTSAQMPANPNTHYESKNIVGLTASSTTNTTAAITTNGIYLNHIENSALKSSHKISGSGATTVTADASGNIIINSANTKVDSAANHYTPATDSSITVTASSTTAASWNSTSLVTGITISKDSKGHITGVTLTSVKMPSNPNSDTKVTNTLNTTTKGYITATTGASTNTGTQIFDTGVYLGTSAGYLHATTFVGSLSGNATTATTATKLSTTGHNLVGGGITAVSSLNGNIVINTPVSYNSDTKTLILGA